MIEALLDWLCGTRQATAVQIRIKELEQGPAWWRLHKEMNPLPGLSAQAEAVRAAFLAPFILIIHPLSDYADRQSRTQARELWDVIRQVPSKVWETLTIEEVKNEEKWREIKDLLLTV